MARVENSLVWPLSDPFTRKHLNCTKIETPSRTMFLENKASSQFSPVQSVGRKFAPVATFFSRVNR